MKKVAIIGAGACGILLANLLKDDFDVTLFEKNNKLGKKVLASGNGKCNFTNIGNYRGKYNNGFANKIVDKYDSYHFRTYLSSLGFAYRVDSEKRAYPLSESSVSLLNILKKGLNKTKILLDTKVIKLEKDNNEVKVFYDDKVENFDYVVCCSGSKASNLGSEYAYSYLENSGIKITDLRPSLVPVKVKEDLKELEGVRVKCLVKLFKNGEFFYNEVGEVLFKEDALSGIVIFNMSSIINRDINNKYEIVLDLLHDSYSDITSDDLIGLVHPKMCEYLTLNDITDLTNLRFNVTGVESMKYAQVVSGGVMLNQVNLDLTLKDNPHILIGGEVLDCDGVCGGYNLQFAFSCAFTINETLRNGESIDE